MKFSVLFRGAWNALQKNKKRSFLTMIGIIIGIAAVSTIVAIGNGFEKYVIDAFIPGEGELIKVNLYFNATDSAMWENNEPAYSDLDIQQVNQIEGVELAEKPVYDATETYMQVGLEYESDDPWQDDSEMVVFKEDKGSAAFVGRSLDSVDSLTQSKVAVIPLNLAESIRPDVEGLLGKGLPLNEVTYTIVGIYDPSMAVEMEGTMDGLWEDEIYFSEGIEIPKSSYDKYHGTSEDNYTLDITIEQGYIPSEVMTSVVGYLEAEGSVKDRGYYEHWDPSEGDDELARVLQQITLFIACIAGISLFVAGIGVMNMMYISVSERTREIGIRRAMGATQKSIRLQFVLEGMLMTCLGGFFGYVFGLLFANAAASLLPFSVGIDIQTIFLSLGISALIGLVFSYAPANAAGKKEIIEIL